jgi:phytanoyl-CoA hydroxylase
MIDQTLVQLYREQGFVVVPGLFSAAEVAGYQAHFMALNAQRIGGYQGDRIDNPTDPLAQYPRMVHPHRWDDLSLRWLLDARLRAWLTALLGSEPYAAQTMFYFKPPGARGQALHQDNRYLEVQPGTCIAAWLAVDDCDEQNGCLQIVPGTHDLPSLCNVPADTTQSFSGTTVPLADWMQPQPVIMQAGDVLFFNGQVIHGSFPNTSADRFRRSLIGHYIVGEAEKVAQFYHPALRMDGSVVELGVSEHGGPCGVWVDEAGQQVVEIIDNNGRI